MSMKINCPKCKKELDMHDYEDTFRDGDEVFVDCPECKHEFYVEPVVKISFIVGGELSDEWD